MISLLQLPPEWGGELLMFLCFMRKGGEVPKPTLTFTNDYKCNLRFSFDCSGVG